MDITKINLTRNISTTSMPITNNNVINSEINFLDIWNNARTHDSGIVNEIKKTFVANVHTHSLSKIYNESTLSMVGFNNVSISPNILKKME